MADTIRTIIAADLPEFVREELARIQAELRTEKFKFRWVKPENIHLTLIFLGDVDPEMLEVISGAVANTVQCHDPIRLAIQGLGVFPGIKRPRIIWAGMMGEVKNLRELKVSLDRSLLKVNGLKFKPERRSFRAHLTLGRAKGRIDGRKLAVAMNRLQKVPSAPLIIDAIHVFKSDLQAGGAVYTKVKSCNMTRENVSRRGAETQRKMIEIVKIPKH